MDNDSAHDTGKPYTCKHVRTVWRKVIGNLRQRCRKAPVAYPTLSSVITTHCFMSLKKQGLNVVYNQPFTVKYKGNIVGEYFADLVVNNTVILELKSVKAINDSHKAQLINYLYISDCRVGYLLNFQGLQLEWQRLVI